MNSVKNKKMEKKKEKKNGEKNHNKIQNIVFIFVKFIDVENKSRYC